MTVTSLVAAVAPRTGQMIKNGLSVFERGESLLLSKSSEIGLEVT